MLQRARLVRSTANSNSSPSALGATATPGRKQPPRLDQEDQSPLGAFCQRCRTAPSAPTQKTSMCPSAFLPALILLLPNEQRSCGLPSPRTMHKAKQKRRKSKLHPTSTARRGTSQK